MNLKRYILSSLAVTIFLFAYGWTVHGLILKDFYVNSPLWRPAGESMCGVMLFAQILFPLVFGYIFLQHYENKGIAEGARYGFLIGLLFVPNNLIFYAIQPLPLNLVICWIIGGMIEMTLAGAIFAALYRKS